MRIIPVVALLLTLSALPGESMAQCMTCGPGLRCTQTTLPVAQACLELPFNCILSGFCIAKGGRYIDGLESSVVGITLLEPSGTITPPPRTLLRAGRALIGLEAARAMKSRVSSASPEPEVVFSTLLHGGVGSTIALRSPLGDGFALRRDRANGERLSVIALENGRPGRVLASERLGEDDLLIVPVRFGGRTRVVALQSLRARSDDLDSRLAPWRSAMAEGAPAAESMPPFEVEAIDP